MIAAFYVAPGAITLVEFRVRYGYRCKRVACTYCQNNHYGGQWGSCRSEDSGTRYRVSRADGTIVCAELSAQQAWKTAYQREQPRFAPILIARDAIAEGRTAEALLIADQLDPDLAVPLRREVLEAGQTASSANAARFVCRDCGQVYERWSARCSNCLSLNGLIFAAPHPGALPLVEVDAVLLDGRRRS